MTRWARKESDRGFTLMELLVSLGVVSILFSGVAVFFSDTSKRAHDLKLTVQTREDARAVFDLISFELRMAGSGMPLGQADFAPGSSGLGDAPLAILADATDTLISFRMSSDGQAAVLTADFNPAGGLTLALNTTAKLRPGYTVYVSNMPRGGSGGLQAEIAQISGLEVDLEADYAASPGAVFEAGSILYAVRTVTYDASDPQAGLMRISDGSALLVAQNVSVQFNYLDENGNSLSLPLNNDRISNQLAAVRVTVTANSERQLSDGSVYTTELEQQVALRNLVFYH